MNQIFPRTLIACLTFAILMALPAQAQNEGDEARMSEPDDIVQTAQDTEGFNTLVKALEAADLAETLKGEGPFTVFAPTDEAFEALPEGTLEELLQSENKSQLQSILKYHVVEGKAMASDVSSMEQTATLAGPELGITVQDETVMLTGENTANVTQTDIEASNGVIHVIDSVLMPPAQTAMQDKN